jgi:hypothetical protein
MWTLVLCRRLDLTERSGPEGWEGDDRHCDGVGIRCASKMACAWVGEGVCTD